MRNLQKVLSVSVLLIAAVPAQEMDLPTFSVDESKATIEWKINELKSAEISEASVTPPKISIAIKSKSKLEIERSSEEKMRLVVYCSKPGLLIGRKGIDIESLRKDLNKMVNKDVYIDIREVKRPEIDSQLVAENIALQLERRVAYRRAMKRSMSSALRLGAIGIKVMVSGRLGGAEIARSEWYREGRVPLSTLRADIDYGFAEAKTTYGIIGIKVWIFKGEVIKRKEKTKGVENASA